MPIPVTCPSCGRNIVAPDNLAGVQVSCKECGSLFMVPDKAAPVPQIAAPDISEATQAKVCRSCGVDVSRTRRTKDASGDYYCDTCWSAKQEAAREAAAPLAPPPAPRARRAGPASADNPPPNFEGETPPADDDPPAGKDTIYYPCGVCELLCSAREVFDEGAGQVICKSCFNLRQRKAKAAAAEGADGADGSDVPLPTPGSAGGGAGEIFCEGCQGIFPADKLKLASDGAVLCKKCMKARGRAA
ncbi:MAG TPA: hypothetical protein VFC78_07760 [Tepidisphaeraceae bacterium]|nr:hypothetical protein [Tepidisphaeraceae bacterium]